MNNELYHHGILGQKWGVRRYQNYDGSYTQAGVKRYKTSLGEYNHQNERYKNLKKSGADKAKIVNAKVARVKAEKKLKKDYKHLKQDKLADQGKKLYSNGNTVRGNEAVTRSLTTIGTVSLLVANGLFNSDANAKVVNALTAIGGLSLTTSAIKSYADNYNNKRLRAYYNHTSNY